MTRCFSNAHIVLCDTILHGSLKVDSTGQICELFAEKFVHQNAEDLGGDYLLPGFVDVHTDNLERLVQPRSNVRWPSLSAFINHDSQCVAAGITTAADALCVGDTGFESGRIQTMTDAIADLEKLIERGLLKSDHFLHLDCEI